MGWFADRVGVGVLGLLPLLLAGCFWPVPGGDPNRQAHNSLEDRIGVATVARLQRAWEAPLGDGAANDPVTSNAGVHVGDATHVYGFDTATGALSWRYGVAADVELQLEQPVAHGDQVLAGRWNPTATPETDPTASDMTESFDAATGASDDVQRGVVVTRRGNHALLWGTDYVRLGMGQFPYWAQQLLVVDLDTGTEVCCNGSWPYDPTTTPRPPPPPSAVTLGTEWVFHAGPGVNDPVSVPLPGNFANGVRGISLTDTVSCLGFYTCPTWAVPIDGTTATPPVLSDDESVVYVGTDAGTVYAVDVVTATVLWSAPVGSAVTDAPALAEDRLFVPTESGDLVVLDATGCGMATCEPLWTAPTGSSLTQQPAVANKVVFTGSASGAVQAFDATGCSTATCEPLWTADVASEITGAPAVSDGQLYAGTADGRLVAWRLADD